MKSVRVLILFLLFAVALPLGARENRQIRWKPVKGARGYVIQYRRIPDGDVEELRVKRPRADLRLPAGRYLLRVAALNKFLKPSVWTDWTPVRLDRISAVVDLARAQKKDQQVRDEPGVDPAGSAKTAEAEGAPADTAGRAGNESNLADGETENETGEDAPASLSRVASRLIPGVPQIARGQPLRGATYWMLFAGLGGAGASEWSAAEAIARDLRNDPTFLALLILPNSLELGLFLREERLRSEREFVRHQQNQAAIGAGALLLYAIHLVDAFWLAPEASPEPATPGDVPGVRLDLLPDFARAGGVQVRFEFRMRL